VQLALEVNGVQVDIELPGVTEAAYDDAQARLHGALANPATKNRDAICDTFLHILKDSPGANASDLWHHVVYRLYCVTLPRYRRENPQQSWVRASGEALELAVQRWYEPLLSPLGIRIQALISPNKKKDVLQQMELAGLVGASKLDMSLHARMTSDRWNVFGGVHVKASLAERVSDDVPASRAMMQRGYFSPLWTLDVKSFPPPHGDLINRGELGTPADPSDKRRYIEEHGDFDGCYSANSRTAASAQRTPSGRRIVTLNLLEQPDEFVRDVIARATAVRSQASD